jgi:broad specificity phosphatase PhoE
MITPNTIQQKTAYAKTIPKIQKPYTRIYLIRHCHPDYTKKGITGDLDMPLSAIGRRQRVCLYRKLKQIKLEKLYASEYKRSQQTAEIFARRRHKKVIIDKRLNEIDWADWYKIKYFNMSEKTRIKRVKKHQQMDARLYKLQTRVRRLVADIYKNHKNQRIGLFCHGNIIRAIITSILQTDVIGFLSLEIYQSSVTKLVIDKNGYIKINYINNICHLPRKPNEDIFSSALNQ